MNNPAGTIRISRRSSLRLYNMKISPEGECSRLGLLHTPIEVSQCAPGLGTWKRNRPRPSSSPIHGGAFSLTSLSPSSDPWSLTPSLPRRDQAFICAPLRDCQPLESYSLDGRGSGSPSNSRLMIARKLLPFVRAQYPPELEAIDLPVGRRNKGGRANPARE